MSLISVKTNSKENLNSLVNDVKADDDSAKPICICPKCGTPVMHIWEWGFDEAEHEPTCLECGEFLDLPEGY